MTRELAIVVPSRTDEYLERLFSSLSASEPGSVSHCFVADNGLSDGFRDRWSTAHYIDTPQPFVFSQAINRCLGAVRTYSDVFIVNDDAEMVTPNWYTVAQALLAHPATFEFGALSCMVDGGVGNPEQRLRHTPKPGVYVAEGSLCFVAVLIRAAVLSQVGTLDEQFSGYGFDDDDYCRRMRDARWSLGVASHLVVRHGIGVLHSSSFARYHGDALPRMFDDNRRKFEAKWSAPKAHSVAT